MENHRQEELKAIYKFIDGASVEEVASIISEIRVCHDNLWVFNNEYLSLHQIYSVDVIGDTIGLVIGESLELTLEDTLEE